LTTRAKIIEHGRRIRACLKQPESAPLAVPAQITVLLALTANLFDPVPLDRMTEAGSAVREATASIPAEVCARFETATKLNDEDKKAIIESRVKHWRLSNPSLTPSRS